MFKKFKERQKEVKNYEKNKNIRKKDRLNDLRDKVKFDVRHKNTPIPVDINTFDKLQKEYEKLNKKGKTWGFGVGSRVPLDEKTKWEKKVKNYNKYSEKPLNAKSDPQPGPAHYSLICHWKGKVTRKNKDEMNKKPNFLSKISKGPQINPYYKKFN